MSILEVQRQMQPSSSSPCNQMAQATHKEYPRVKSEWKAVSLVLRIATIALAVASVAVMTSANESTTGGGCGCAPAGEEVSYSDYNSFKYGLGANVVSVVLQVAAAWLTAGGSEDHGKLAKAAAELLDTVSQMFLYSSSGLSLSVDNFGRCGRRVSGVCKCSGVFCRWVRSLGGLSIAAAISLALSQYVKDVHLGDDDDKLAGHGHNHNHD
ncbi:hypothetical protein QOZ80_5BG0441160 [Eleusine coracana subsp. coracana]|nr:hypothetical protein QOZ80_5BG0441160 [Eleusine coracana subsp. coracana]